MQINKWQAKRFYGPEEETFDNGRIVVNTAKSNKCKIEIKEFEEKDLGVWTCRAIVENPTTGELNLYKGAIYFKHRSLIHFEIGDGKGKTVISDNGKVEKFNNLLILIQVTVRGSRCIFRQR